VPRDELWTTTGVLEIITGAGVMIAVEAAAGRMLCAGIVPTGARLVVGAGAIDSTFGAMLLRSELESALLKTPLTLSEVLSSGEKAWWAGGGRQYAEMSLSLGELGRVPIGFGGA